ncbi:hypothetical protein BDY21DRAFT_352952 [Lineolata rhizophorae]|uniref:Uncharacterized protein n=1 Tax=Lineolata rhizophorae TaxID=578093 RepID=A0A6A6NSR0_9PEZI|nr:hypothetical protein BDY21DRAFT_352952 [Lineolata rhizophorae]
MRGAGRGHVGAKLESSRAAGRAGPSFSPPIAGRRATCPLVRLREQACSLSLLLFCFFLTVLATFAGVLRSAACRIDASALVLVQLELVWLGLAGKGGGAFSVAEPLSASSPIVVVAVPGCRSLVLSQGITHVYLPACLPRYLYTPDPHPGRSASPLVRELALCAPRYIPRSLQVASRRLRTYVLALAAAQKRGEGKEARSPVRAMRAGRR